MTGTAVAAKTVAVTFADFRQVEPREFDTELVVAFDHLAFSWAVGILRLAEFEVKPGKAAPSSDVGPYDIEKIEVKKATWTQNWTLYRVAARARLDHELFVVIDLACNQEGEIDPSRSLIRFERHTAMAG
ncbi:MAG TPA: hypothetical protein VLF21_00155 [Candidatus Saccharimonadales bacterium]|nr:hypothetical protein [Candidatus Saccharimonadales bacterium]